MWNLFEPLRLTLPWLGDLARAGQWPPAVNVSVSGDVEEAAGTRATWPRQDAVS